MCSLQLPDRIPFVYIIRDTSNNKKYAGVKFSNGCKPSDILTSYFTSSKVVKSLIKQGREFVIDKIVEFETKEDAIEFEELLLLTVNAHLTDDWYNFTAGRSINPDAVKQTCLAMYGVDNWMKTEAAKESGIGFKLGNTYGCFERSEETRAKMSAAREGVTRPVSFSEKMSVLMKGENNPMYGKTSHRKGIKDDQIQCEHCGKLSNKGNYIRWHGSSCRHANDPHLSLNTTAAEVTTDDSVDPEAAGFIVNQNTANNINVNGASYIFLAVA